MHYFLKILNYIKPYSPFAILNILSNIISVLFSLVSLTMVIPFLGILFGTQEKVYNAQPLSFKTDAIKDNFYALISSIIDQKGEIEALLFICILVLTTFFFRNLFRYLALYFLTPIRNGIVHDIRMDLHKKIISLPLPFFTKKRKGDLTARLTSDLVEIEWSIMSSIEMIFKDPLTIIIYLLTLIAISAKLTLFVIVLFPITGIIIGIIGKSLKKSSEKGQKKMGDLLAIIDENIAGLRIIKAFNAESYINKNFEKESEGYKNIMTGLLRKKDLSSPMSELLSTIVMVIVMWFGGQLVLSGNGILSAEEFIGYILIFSQIIPPAKSLTSSYYHIKKGSAAAQRIYEVLDTENEITDIDQPKSIKILNTNIEFKNITFKYEDIKVLTDVNFNIKKGKMVALVGKSGCGKSTLADLLSRFYDVNEGGIFIDNTNIKDIAMADLKSLMGIVSQESILFNDTIYNNIRLGKIDATKDEIIAAAKVANAHKFILETENGYNTNIGDRGSKLSGGQKQRLSIARAILKSPEILILDEATSSLDTESEKLVQEALENLMRSRTSLVIAHRLSTIKNADEIIVLDKGKIIERGSHQQLISQDGHYKKFSDLQSFS
ncbi:MAG: antibiotic ABC transporter ATP-binding protein [Flavobacteriales bacterium]|nr:antibiotic ABC transporter ATP-binding protein [Flavobacteriales bacterium]|tara:strand:- start:1501 stop:3321 length:1821 start_codon:yes stop_codon:yes gene_type:complete